MKEAQLRQYAGWSPKSQTHTRYVHLGGSEANEVILREAGLLPPENQDKDLLKPECPQCSEPNEPNAKICVSCKAALSFQAYADAVEAEKQKRRELKMLKR